MLFKVNLCARGIGRVLSIHFNFVTLVRNVEKDGVVRYKDPFDRRIGNLNRDHD